MLCRIRVLPEQRNIEAPVGTPLLDVLRSAGMMEHAPCGGRGTCGKCRVLVEGKPVLACQTLVDGDMTVTLPSKLRPKILTDGIAVPIEIHCGTALAVDLGTTTVAAYWLEDGKVLYTKSCANPQATFGGDVVSRLQHARKGQAQALTAAVRTCVQALTVDLLTRSGTSFPDTVCLVGNPAMQQLFLGLPVDNLIRIPFLPLLTQAKTEDGGKYIPEWTGTKLLTVPDISGYVGADTVAGILATGMDRTEALTLLVDIGTNGEMVLGNRHRMVACATAAGPALEGAGIQWGMQAAPGAIDRVDRGFSCHVLGQTQAVGICGSGLLDAVAVVLEQERIDPRGRLLDAPLSLTGQVFLTQEDIRQLQQAKGAIAAGIVCMTEHLGVSLQEIETVYLAGAFGTFLDPDSACRIGLLPVELADRIVAVGNAAGSGAVQMACDPEAFARADAIVTLVEHLELAAAPKWAKTFAKAMRFHTETDYWQRKAKAFGFSHTAALRPETLVAREDVRNMCVENLCRAYGRNWTCPPHCGTLDRCQEQMQAYRRGILLQTVGVLKKAVDSKAYRETEQRHLRQLYALAEQVKQRHPEALCLGSGGCRICEACAWPEPCRFPEKACASMEAYGLFVTDVCRENGLAYHHGEKTVTYTACILF